MSAFAIECASVLLAHGASPLVKVDWRTVAPKFHHLPFPLRVSRQWWENTGVYAGMPQLIGLFLPHHAWARRGAAVVGCAVAAWVMYGVPLPGPKPKSRVWLGPRPPRVARHDGAAGGGGERDRGM